MPEPAGGGSLTADSVIVTGPPAGLVTAATTGWAGVAGSTGTRTSPDSKPDARILLRGEAVERRLPPGRR